MKKTYDILSTWVGPAFMILWFIGLFTSETLALIGLVGMIASLYIEFMIVSWVLYPRAQSNAAFYERLHASAENDVSELIALVRKQVP